VIAKAPTFSIGIECNADEITGIDYLEPCTELAPKTPLAQGGRAPVARLARRMRPSSSACRWHRPAPISSAASGRRSRPYRPVKRMSYGEVAAAIRSGPRAVGNACGANPYPIVVPCHRVVAANHGLGGFARNSGGFLLDIKRWLLRHERQCALSTSMLRSMTYAGLA
jgi:methylated-DNA-[protein]-cysteine S-methyltransferase